MGLLSKEQLDLPGGGLRKWVIEEAEFDQHKRLFFPLTAEVVKGFDMFFPLPLLQLSLFIASVSE